MFNEYPWGRWIKWGIVALLIFVVIIGLISNYNSLVSANQDVESKWSQVENVMQSRADKLNNLVEVVKGYTKHEEKVFGDIAAARSTLYNNTSDIKSKLDADTAIANSLRGLLAIVENYPNLKASEQYTNLQVAIEGAENRVSVERKRFIDSTQTFNTKVTRFPGNIFARMMGFPPKNYFQASPDATKAPQIKF